MSPSPVFSRSAPRLRGVPVLFPSPGIDAVRGQGGAARSGPRPHRRPRPGAGAAGRRDPRLSGRSPGGAVPAGEGPGAGDRRRRAAARSHGRRGHRSGQPQHRFRRTRWRIWRPWPQAPGRYLLEVGSPEQGGPPGRYRLEVAALRPATGGEDALRSRGGAGGLGSVPSGPARARDRSQALERALGLWERLGERRRMAEALFGLGSSWLSPSGRAETAAEDFLRSAALWQGAARPGGEELAARLSTSGPACSSSWDARTRRGSITRRRSRSPAAPGDAQIQAASLSNLAMLAIDQGEFRQGIAAFLEVASEGP